MKYGGQIPRNAIPICETFKISCLRRRVHTKGVLGNHLKDQSFRLVHWLSITYLCEGPVKNPSTWKENLTWIVPRIRSCTRGEFGRVTCWLQTLGSWKRWTHRKSTQKRLNAKEVKFPRKMENLFFQSQMDESNFLEEIRN